MWDSLSIEAHLDDIKKMLEGGIDRTGYIALLDDNEGAGFAEICIRDYANGCKAQPVAFLEGIWVEPEHQQRSIGRELVAVIENDLVSRGFHELCSDAHVENTISHHAHGKWGFDETDRVVYFRKSLDRKAKPGPNRS
ncbi:MAG: GNAT family N-acetyltransferase [Sulfitobacter sp.]